MVTQTKTKIIEYITKNGQARAHDLMDHLSIGRAAIHRQLNKLTGSGILTKSGTPPKVYYSIAANIIHISEHTGNLLLDKYFAYVDPIGNLTTGQQGFYNWLENVHKSLQKDSLLKRYIQDRNDVNQFFSKDGYINATKSFKNTHGADFHLDGVFYLDFYSLPTFGKTRLGALMLYAKQSENIRLMKQLADEVKQPLTKLIEKLRVDAIGYIPHSIIRKIQMNKELEKYLGISLPTVQIEKAYPGNIRVAQKTLGKLEERVKNARETIFVTRLNRQYENILLIDDAVGSGATLNETAGKIKHVRMAQKVYGFGIVGSLKGFEVIREV